MFGDFRWILHLLHLPRDGAEPLFAQIKPKAASAYHTHRLHVRWTQSPLKNALMVPSMLGSVARYDASESSIVDLMLLL